MSRSLAKRGGFSTQRKSDTYTLMNVDGNPFTARDEKVDEETKPLPVAIQQRHEELTLDLVEMATHDTVLGMPWLKEHNPEVDWKVRVVKAKDVTTQFTSSLRIGSVRWWMRGRIETRSQDSKTKPTRQYTDRGQRSQSKCRNMRTI